MVLISTWAPDYVASAVSTEFFKKHEEAENVLLMRGHIVLRIWKLKWYIAAEVMVTTLTSDFLTEIWTAFILLRGPSVRILYRKGGDKLLYNKDPPAPWATGGSLSKLPKNGN